MANDDSPPPLPTYIFSMDCVSPPGGYCIVKHDTAGTGLIVCASQDHPDEYLVLVIPSSRLRAAKQQRLYDAVDRLLGINRRRRDF